MSKTVTAGQTDYIKRLKISLKEITSTMIAVSIVALNVYIFYKIVRLEGQALPAGLLDNLNSSPDETKKSIDTWNILADARFSRLKDILLVGTGFLGLVMGYYFGRIPAERALKNAEKQVDTALKSEAATRADNAQTHDLLDAVVAAGQDVVESGTQAIEGEDFTVESANREAALNRLKSSIEKSRAQHHHP